MKAFLFLVLAILFEVFGSVMLKQSDGFTNIPATIGVGIGFLTAFVCLGFALKSIPLSVAYATWSGIGTALTAIVGFFLFQEHFNVLKITGLFFVIIGIVLLNTSQGKEKNEVNADLQVQRMEQQP